MSTESILKPVLEIKGDKAAQKLLEVLEGPVLETPRPSTDTVRWLDGGAEFIDHALVANNFVITVGNQLAAGQRRVFERVPYRLSENNHQDIVPDLSIVLDVEKRTAIAFKSTPCFVMEIIGSAWERTTCRKKMEVYRRVRVSECWVADWQEKSIEIYLFAEADSEEIDKYLKKTITEENRDELKISTFPDITISFEELFAGVNDKADEESVVLSKEED